MNTVNRLYELFSVGYVRKRISVKNFTLILKIANFCARSSQTKLPTNVKEHYTSLPCACCAFNDPVSSIGSVGSLVIQ